MLIIFEDQVALLQDRYITLELDTVKFGANGAPKTAFCVVENPSLDNMPRLDQLRQRHQQLIQHYRSQEWLSCLDDIQALTGEWNGELDTFYQDLQTRVEALQNACPDNWDPVVLKQI